ncbi:Malonyl CoA-acyl carrier protein transacylase [Actinosynnema pretiosum subsp. pretiosum]|nr:Malonyl CoA-acyl carrier protein transacylase [Actinosynnema pretiosum subsp. pretiosum]
MATTGLRLPATVVYDHPTPSALADHLTVLLSRDAQADERAESAPPGLEPVVVVGSACRLPGGVGTPEALWERLVAGEPPAAGVVGATRFDAAFFDLSPEAAAEVDEGERLLLETAWEALERAGITPRALRGTATGVFTGGRSPGRVVRALALEGPSIGVADGAELVAVHLAAQSLRSGESVLALVGGVDADGRTGVLVLERLVDATRNDRRPLVVVRGSAVNSDGAGSAAGQGVPARRRVVLRALESAGLTEGQAPARAGFDGRITGIVLVAQAMRHGLLPPSGDSPDPGQWPEPHRVGLSAFGSGVNAHLVLERPARRPNPNPTRAPAARCRGCCPPAPRARCASRPPGSARTWPPPPPGHRPTSAARSPPAPTSSTARCCSAATAPSCSPRWPTSTPSRDRRGRCCCCPAWARSARAWAATCTTRSRCSPRRGTRWRPGSRRR